MTGWVAINAAVWLSRNWRGRREVVVSIWLKCVAKAIVRHSGGAGHVVGADPATIQTFVRLLNRFHTWNVRGLEAMNQRRCSIIGFLLAIQSTKRQFLAALVLRFESLIQIGNKTRICLTCLSYLRPHFMCWVPQLLDDDLYYILVYLFSWLIWIVNQIFPIKIFSAIRLLFICSDYMAIWSLNLSRCFDIADELSWKNWDRMRVGCDNFRLEVLLWDGIWCFGSLIVVHLLVQVLRMGSLLDGEVFFSFNFVYLIFWRPYYLLKPWMG